MSLLSIALSDDMERLQGSVVWLCVQDHGRDAGGALTGDRCYRFVSRFGERS